MKLSRRHMLLASGSAALGSAAPGSTETGGAVNANAAAQPASEPPPVTRVSGYKPVRTLNGWTLPYQMKNGVKEFHLVAEEIEHEFAPGCRAR